MRIQSPMLYPSSRGPNTSHSSPDLRVSPGVQIFPVIENSHSVFIIYVHTLCSHSVVTLRVHTLWSQRVVTLCCHTVLTLRAHILCSHSELLLCVDTLSSHARVLTLSVLFWSTFSTQSSWRAFNWKRYQLFFFYSLWNFFEFLHSQVSQFRNLGSNIANAGWVDLFRLACYYLRITSRFFTCICIIIFKFTAPVIAQ